MCRNNKSLFNFAPPETEDESPMPGIILLPVPHSVMPS
jgi:hypothetical protein